jgi:manganese/zinc/iron transport system substrate-binding protein
MIKYILSTLIAFLLLACSGTDHNAELKRWMQNNDKIKVLATTAMITDLVQQIGKEQVDCITLIKGDLDPHSYQPVKGDDEKFSSADLIFYNGLGLEHGPSWQQYLSQSGKATGLGNRLQTDHPALILYDDNGQRDPHIWTDISLWAKTVPYIVEALSKRDPAHQAEFRKNGDALYQSLMASHEKAYVQLQKIPEQSRYLVTSHDAFNYFSRAYLSTEHEREQQNWHKRFAAPEGLAPDSQLSTTDIQAIVHHLKQYRIHVLFPESNVSKDSIKKIVDAGREIGLELIIAETPLYGDAMGPPGSDGDTYLKMVEHNVRTISNFLMENEQKIAIDSIHSQSTHCQL